MPLPALGELPQLKALSLAWRRLVDLKPVLMLVNNTSLVCCWEQRGRWQQRVVGWPEGVCRDGVPLQREAVGELIADLIFDCDCPGAELVLCLPLEAASWCVVEGYGADGSPGLLPQAFQSVDLPFELAESYVTSSIGRPYANEGFIAVGTQVTTNYEVTPGQNGAPNSCQPEESTAGLTFGARVSKLMIMDS